MSGLSRILINFSSMTLMRLVTAGLSFLLIMLIARLWGPEPLGQFSTLFSFFMFTQQLPLLGLHLVVLRNVAADPNAAARETTNALGVSMPIGLILVLALGLIGYVLYPASMHISFWLVGLSCLPTAFTVVAESVLIGQERIHLVASTLVMENLIRTALCIAFAWSGIGLAYLFAAFLMGRLVAVFLYWRMAGFNRLVRWSEFGWQFIRKYLSRVHIFLGIMIFSASFGRLDFILLSKLGSLVEVGYYSPAYKIYELGMMLPSMIAVVMYPIFTRKFEESFTVFRDMHYSLTRFLFGLGVPAVIILAAVAGHVIALLFGPEYSASITVMQLLAFAMLFMAQDQLMALVMLSSHRENLDLRTLTFSFGLNVLLLLILIPPLGCLGAAWAAFGTGVFRLILRYFFSIKSMNIGFRPNLILSPLAAGAVMGLILWGLKDWNQIMALSAGLVAYLVVWIGAKGVTKDSIRKFRQVLTEGK